MIDRSIVAVYNTDYTSLKATVESIFLRFPFDFKNRLVWVKPNIMGNIKPDRHATTHPALVLAVTETLIGLKAKVVVGDNPAVPSVISEDKTAKASGILEASQGMFQIISKEITRKHLDKNGIKETISVAGIVDDCDFFISLPKMKTHLHTFLTGAVKNSYGMVVGVQKPDFHRKYPKRNDFAGLIAEIYNFRKPDLIIMDGVTAMEGDGPNCSNLRKVNRVIASTDGVALDHYVAKIMGMDSRRIPLLEYCVQNGFGSDDYRVEGDNSPIADYLLPKTYYDPSERNQNFLQSLLYKYVVEKKLTIDRDKCSKCLSCFKICPSKAISVEDYPEIDSQECILCYCCRENCQEEAITFPLSYKISQKILAELENIRNR